MNFSNSEGPESTCSCEGKASLWDSRPCTHEIDGESFENGWNVLACEPFVIRNWGCAVFGTRSQIRHDLDRSLSESIVLWRAVRVFGQESHAVGVSTFPHCHDWPADPWTIHCWELLHAEILVVAEEGALLESIWIDKVALGSVLVFTVFFHMEFPAGPVVAVLANAETSCMSWCDSSFIPSPWCDQEVAFSIVGDHVSELNVLFVGW